MEHTVSFPLFASGGFVNATLFSVPGPIVWDFQAGFWRAKQTREFDGGWRWYDSYTASALALYNVKLHKMAHTVISHKEIEDSANGPEFVLLCAKSRVIVDHNAFEAKEMAIDKIRADFRKLRTELGINWYKR